MQDKGTSGHPSRARLGLSVLSLGAVKASLRRGSPDRRVRLVAFLLAGLATIALNVSVPTAGAAPRNREVVSVPLPQDASQASNIVKNLPPPYTITDLGDFSTDGTGSGTGPSKAFSISDSGAVVGAAQDRDKDNTLRPFIWQEVNGKPQFDKLVPVISSSPQFLSDGGTNKLAIQDVTMGNAKVPVIAGDVLVKGVYRAERWDSRVSLPYDLIADYNNPPSDPCNPSPTPPTGVPGCEANGINRNGDVVGDIGEPGMVPTQTAWIHLFGQSTFIALNGGGSSAIALAINDKGVIVGCQTINSGICSRIVLWPSPTATPEVLFRGTPRSINKDGIIVGSDSVTLHAFVYRNSGLADLGTLPGDTVSVANAINDAGEIGGWSSNGSVQRAVMWQNGQIIDLNSVLPSNSGWTLISATGINNRGDIVGTGMHNGVMRAFLLRVVPLVFVPGAGASTLNNATMNADEWLGCIGRHFMSFANRLDLSLFSEVSPQTLYASDVHRHAACWNIDDKVFAELNGYGTLIDTLKANGYREYNSVANTYNDISRRTLTGCDLSQQATNAPNLFLFAYDWRQDLNVTAQALAEYILCVQKFFPDGRQINVIAHSLGNIVTRRYQLLNLTNPIGRFISVSPPWLGAPKILNVLLTGDFASNAQGPDVAHVAASFPSVFALAPNRLLAQRLLTDRLPTDPFGGFVLSLLSPISGQNGPYSGQSFDEMASWVDANYPQDFQGQHYPHYNPFVYNDVFHSKPGQDNFSADASPFPSTKYFEFYGVQADNRTIGGVYQVPEYDCTAAGTQQHGLDCPALSEQKCGAAGNGLDCPPLSALYGTTLVPGDGTVPVDSALLPSWALPQASGIFNLIKCQSPNSSMDSSVEHTQILLNPEVLNDIVSLLRDVDTITHPPHSECAFTSPTSSTLSTHASASGMDLDPLTYQVTVTGESNLAVADDLGNSTNGTKNGWEVPGVEVGPASTTAGTALIPVPTARTYTLSYIATNLGTSVEVTTGANGGQLLRWSDLSIPSGDQVTLTISSSGVGLLQYTDKGMIHSLAPTIKVSGTAAADITPPSVRVCAQTSGSATRYSVYASDPDNAVGKVYWSTDGTSYSPYAKPLSLNPATTPTLYAFADDTVGNRSAVAQATLAQLSTTPGLSVQDAIAPDGDPGTTTRATFNVSLNCPSSQTVSVHYKTVNGTALAGRDYKQTSGTLTFAPGKTSAQVQVTILGDTLYTGDTTFSLKLSSPTGATIAQDTATGTIPEDEPPPTITLANTSVVEGDTTTFYISLSAPSGLPVKVDYTTVDGMATAGTDYKQTSGTLTIPAGSITATVTVQSLDDKQIESYESFGLALSNPIRALLATRSAVATITEDNDFGGSSACASANATVTWTGNAGDGMWSSVENWSTGIVPSLNDNVCIPATTSTTAIRSTISVTVNSLESYAPLRIDGAAPGDPSSPVTFTLSSTTIPSVFHSTVSIGSYVNFVPDGLAIFEGTSTLAWGLAYVKALGGTIVITQQATLHVLPIGCDPNNGPCDFGQFQAGTIANLGTIQVDGILDFKAAATLHNQGAIAFGPPVSTGQIPTLGSPSVNDTITSTGTIMYSSSSAEAVLGGNLQLGGSVTVTSGTLVLATLGSFHQTANFSIAAGATLALTDSGTWNLDSGDPVSGGGTLYLGNSSYGIPTINIDVGLTVPVVVNNATVNVNVSIVQQSLTLLAGTVDGSGSMTIPSGGSFTQSVGTVDGALNLMISSGATFAWSGGKMQGTGTTTIAKGATATINTPALVILGGTRAFVNNGSLTLTSVAFQAYGGSFFTNTTTGTLTLQGDARFEFVGVSGGPTMAPFENDGMLIVDAGTGTSSISGSPTNTGTITVNTGTLELTSSSGGTLTESGTIKLASGTTLMFDINSSAGGTFVFPSGSTISGPGTMVVSNGGDVTLNGTFSVPNVWMQGQHLGINVPIAPTTFIMSGDSIDGSGSVTIPSGGSFTQSVGKVVGALNLMISSGATFAWSGGKMQGTGTTTIAKGATATINTPALVILGGTRAFVNNGSLTLTSVAFQAYGGSFFTNTTTGTLTLQGDARFEFVGVSGGPTMAPFENDGMLIVDAGTGTSSISGSPTNTGTITVNTGTLELSDSSGQPGQALEESGTINLASGTTLSLVFGPFVFQPTSTISGPGTMVIGNGGDVTLNGTFSVPNVWMQGQHLGINVPLTPTTFIMSGDSIDGSGSVTIPSGGSFTQSGGTVDGALDLMISSGATFSWSGGKMQGTGTTTIAQGVITATVNGGVSLGDKRLFVLETGLLVNGGSITNNGTFMITGDNGFLVFARSLTFTNNGTLVKSGGTGTADLGSNTQLINSGTVFVLSGTLSVGTYVSQTGATIEVQLSGQAPGTGFGVLNVSGNASFGGKLAVTTVGYTPPSKSTYVFLTYGSETGSFSPIQNPPGGPTFTVAFGSTSASLNAS